MPENKKTITIQRGMKLLTWIYLRILDFHKKSHVLDGILFFRFHVSNEKKGPLVVLPPSYVGGLFHKPCNKDPVIKQPPGTPNNHL